jgi:SAM-dependent methyltransferase
MPERVFDNIVWDAAIEHFTEAEIADLMANIKKRLTPTGILSGFTIVERSDGKKMLPHHEYEFKSKDDLARFFRPHFQNVKVLRRSIPIGTIFIFGPQTGSFRLWKDGSRLLDSPYDDRCRSWLAER